MVVPKRLRAALTMADCLVVHCSYGQRTSAALALRLASMCVAVVNFRRSSAAADVAAVVIALWTHD